MTGQLSAYLRRRVGLQILALLAVLTAMMQLLELLDVTTEILERGQGVGGLLYYALLRLPAELGLALPLAVLLGTMGVLNSMARTLEITAMRASGVSLMRMLGYLMPVLIVFATVQVGLLQVVLPRVELELKQWWNASAPPDEEVKTLWAHTELQIESRGMQRRHLESLEWQTNLSPDEVLRLSVARPYLSTMMLAEVIAGSRAGSQPRSYYETALYRSFTTPLGVFIMLLLAMPTASTLTRGGGGGAQMLLALVLGLAFLLSDGILAALGSSGQLHPLVTALGAPLLFALIGFVRLRWCERP
jgi:lipopolysaccharide export system permease protein